MPTLHYRVVDVFTERPFAGNPLAVVLDADDLATEDLQAIALEFHLSETAFPMQPTQPGADYRLRIFTPETELPFAGHPSIGAAWVLAHLGRIDRGRVVQECGAGLLPIEVDEAEATLTGGAPHVGPELDAAAVLMAVGLSPADLAGWATRSAGTGIDFGYLAVRDDAVARAVPDLPRLRALGGAGVSVFSYDGAGGVHARVFAAGAGVPEDPATGSAALGLGAYLVAVGALAGEGETSYVIRQGEELRRPSTLSCAVRAEGGAAVECRVTGRVVPVASGELRRP
jgi:trans-2,3-dihydro-3-hydroxyanthranilate isomerase